MQIKKDQVCTEEGLCRESIRSSLTGLSDDSVLARDFDSLRALAVVGVEDFAGVRRGTGSSTGPTDATTLTPLSDGTRAGVSGCRGGGGTCCWLGGGASTATAAGCSTLADTDLTLTGTAPALNGDGLVVESTKVHAESGPSIEVVGDGDGTAGPWGLTDGNVLVECGGAGDGWLVDLLVLPDVIRSSVAHHGTHVGSLIGGVADGVLHDIVLHKRAGGPTVDGQETDAGGGESSTVGDGAVRYERQSNSLVQCQVWALLCVTGVPSETDDKVG